MVRTEKRNKTNVNASSRLSNIKPVQAFLSITHLNQKSCLKFRDIVIKCQKRVRKACNRRLSLPRFAGYM